VRISNDFESVRAFYKLHEHLRINKFKKLPQPYIFFIHLYEEFIINRRGFLLEAWNKSELIASWVILIHNKTLFYKMGASNPSQLHLRPNDLLFRSLMQYCSDNGFQTVDLGFSGTAKSYEGLIRFKSKEGGEKLPIYKIEYFPPGFDMSLIIKKTNYLNETTRKAIGSNDLSVIKEVSEKHYGEFA
jgi:lipid II:glycine glycyltransferase (peptidoglycan interpeptide bridge formation enzyme)